jgi:hypothetical protein
MLDPPTDGGKVPRSADRSGRAAFDVKCAVCSFDFGLNRRQ